MTTIVDYGLGNLGSVLNMFKKIGAPAQITADPDVLAKAEKVLLPGVGAFDAAMERLNGTPLREVLDHKALVEKVPTLGICLGMQLLTKGSEEGVLPGLGWIPAFTHRFPPAEGLKVPHMGWNGVKPATPSPLTAGFDPEYRFYFVHSYYVKAEDRRNAILETTHGVTFDSALQQGNIFGAQFHPEKSHRFGMQLFKNFAAL
ncbi:imidazole glycerol phosphate synthase subunit HisH [Flaviaesturariibacter amylovorans]|uniref:Imidazole glycerol phosphate synthase subunit HisH n=1 Tax=Flaviaesturariibacter amylovorans TaxID=1084520 RepID=A0ABP8GBR8_9BACT